MGHNFENLKAHILPLSESNYFNKAKKEWVLIGVHLDDDWDECPCGKEIKELCYIENELNGNKTYVGNVCVKQFIEIDTGNLFAGLRRIMEDIEANANEDLIIHAYKLGYIYSEKEFDFLMETRRKRNLSPKQLAWKKKINRRIINETKVKAT